MHCTTCSLSVKKQLSKIGATDVDVNPISGATYFTVNEPINETALAKDISKLGFQLQNSRTNNKSKKRTWNHKQRFLLTLPFTLLLMLHMTNKWLPLHFLHTPWLQMALCLPPFFLGLYYLGPSALQSIKNKMPNMNVLILLGAIAAFAYSLYGCVLLKDSHYMFFETVAAVISFAFLGSYLEEYTFKNTQTTVQQMVGSQKVMANMIAFDDNYQEQIFEIDNVQLRVGDLILIKNGEQVPLDCKILSGQCSVSEALITGESTPISKTKKDQLIGSSIMVEGTVRAQVTATSEQGVLAGIIGMLQKAQLQKPPIQLLADKINAIFVPTVLCLALLTFLINFYIGDISFKYALLRAAAVLVISCPCAMGLATPASLAVGVGRAAKNGVLFKNAGIMEWCKKLSYVIFDKTGTLTTGKFKIKDYTTTIEDASFKALIYSLEKFSNHPIALSICQQWKQASSNIWQSIEEIKGEGILASDKDGSQYKLGSASFTQQHNSTAHIYLTKNDKLIGSIFIEDEIRPEAIDCIEQLKSKGITSILLSGDQEHKCVAIAKQLGITQIYSEQKPDEKLEIVKAFSNKGITAMVGDGINDAPALAQADIGIAIGNASSITLQTADIILMQNGLQQLSFAIGLGVATHRNIQQNLFWAFAYNIVAIPIAAFGFLSPLLGSLAMAFSDVVLGVNAGRLFIKKIE